MEAGSDYEGYIDIGRELAVLHCVLRDCLTVHSYTEVCIHHLFVLVIRAVCSSHDCDLADSLSFSARQHCSSIMEHEICSQSGLNIAEGEPCHR